jgi:hypothetical protein
MANQPVNKCSFCKYFSGRNCMVKPDSFYCKDALAEYWEWVKNKPSRQPQPQRPKSKYPWK